MTLFEHYDAEIPDYYTTMYMDGCSPEQILYAQHREMIEELDNSSTKPNLEVIIRNDR